MKNVQTMTTRQEPGRRVQATGCRLQVAGYRLDRFSRARTSFEAVEENGKKSAPAFTLIEMIGALAVVTILASLMVPAVVRRIDQAARVRDAAELNGMASALQSLVQRTGRIPGGSTLVSDIANEMARSPGQIATNSRNVARAFLIDPNLWIGSANGKLPYDQSQSVFGTGTNDASGRAIPGQNLRVMILSSISAPLPGSIDFNNAWSTPDGAIPSTWTYAGRSDDLKIQRVDFTPRFARLILNPIDVNCFGGFAIENNQAATATSAVTNVVANAWYLRGTTVRLCDTNFILQRKTVLQDDASYVFENVSWHDQLSGWGTNGPRPWVVASATPADLFTMLATNVCFATPGPGANRNRGDSTWAIVFDFYAFMNDYNSWAQSGFAQQPAALKGLDLPEIRRTIVDMAQ